jgi:hypothetical protein
MPRRLLYIRYKRWQGVYSTSSPLQQLDTEAGKYGGIIMERSYNYNKDRKAMPERNVIQLDRNELSDFFDDVVKEMLLREYSAVQVRTSTACDIWGVSQRMAYNYIKDGKIAPINPGSSDFRFRLSDVLAVNPRRRRKSI